MGHISVFLLLLAAVPVAADEAPVYKTKYRVVNVHRHCALPTEEAIRTEFDVDERVGISAVVILDGDSPTGSLPAWLRVKQKHPDRLIVFWKLNFADVRNTTFFADILRDLEQAVKQGVQGVKVWKDLGMYARDNSGKLLKADDSRLDPFWAKCGALGVPVLWHVADPKEYWYPLTYNSLHYGVRAEKDQHYHNPEMPSWEELIRQRDAVLKKHPKMTVIGAHLGSQGLDLKGLGEMLDRYPNFHVDPAARLRIIGRLNPPAVRDFFTKYQDRILFGSDDMVLSKGRKPGSGGNIAVYPNEDPNWLLRDPTDREAVRHWQNRAAFDYGQYFQYFETDRVDLVDPNHSGGSWLRLAGVKLSPEVLEKLYHANAERLIPGLKK